MRKQLTQLQDLSINCLTFILLICFLPVHISAEVIYATPLKGQEHQIGNMLEWKTATELASEMFIVERSFDGLNYENIGVVNAAGDSNAEKGYRYMDIGVNDKKLFYRLKQVDYDGTSSYSQTVLVKKLMSNNFMVVAMSTTTTNRKFVITLDATLEDQLEYRITNLNNEEITSRIVPLEYGLNDIVIDVENEKEGTYKVYMKLKDEEEMIIIRKVDEATRKIENVASQKRSSGG